MNCKKCYGRGYITVEKGNHVWNCYINSSLNICDCGTAKDIVCEECLGTKKHFISKVDAQKYLEQEKDKIKEHQKIIEKLQAKRDKMNEEINKEKNKISEIKSKLFLSKK